MVENSAIYVVNFNTTEMTNSALKSMRKHSQLPIIVFDNSNKYPFEVDKSISNVKVFDNTHGQIIDFKKEFEAVDAIFHIPYNIKMMHEAGNKFGSFKHCLTIQWMLDNIGYDNVLLFDSDVEVLKDFEELIDETVITTAELYSAPQHYSRFYPFVQYLNVKLMAIAGIRYYDQNRMQDISHFYVGYDTGGSFCEDVLRSKLPYKNIRVTDYIVHYGAGSWKPSKYTGKLEYKSK